MKLKTGAFTPVIPPFWAARKLHAVFFEDPLTGVDPAACNLPDLDIKDALNLFWQIKTYDVTTEWEFKEAPTVEGSIITYTPSKTGTVTKVDVPLINPRNVQDPEGEPEDLIPTNPWRDNPIGLVTGNIDFVDTEYPTDRNAAREAVRQTYTIATVSGSFDFFCSSIEEYPYERAQFIQNFEVYFSEWTARVQSKLETFIEDTSPRGVLWTTDLQRQLLKIPEIYADFKIKYFEPTIARYDYEYYVTNNEQDFNFKIASEIKRYSLDLKNLIAIEEDLEMFDLLKGFEQRLNFLSWHYLKRYGVECLPVRYSFQSESGEFPCGFYFDSVAGKYNATMTVLPNIPGYSDYGWKLTVEKPYIALQRNFSGSITNINRIAKKSLTFKPANRTFLGLELERTRDIDPQLIATGEVHGGNYFGYDEEGGEISGTISLSYEEAFDEIGDQIDLGDPPDFNTILQDPNANDYVYSGDYFSPLSFAGAIGFFQDIATAVQDLKVAGNEEIGKLKFVSKEDELIYETPIFGNIGAWEKFNVTYKIKKRWDEETTP